MSIWTGKVAGLSLQTKHKLLANLLCYSVVGRTMMFMSSACAWRSSKWTPLWHLLSNCARLHSIDLATPFYLQSSYLEREDLTAEQTSTNNLTLQHYIVAASQLGRTQECSHTSDDKKLLHVLMTFISPCPSEN